MVEQREQVEQQIKAALGGDAASFVVNNARKIDANGIAEHFWLAADGGKIVATGSSDAELATFLNARESNEAPQRFQRIDAEEKIITPGFIDLHAHGAWAAAFDDGPEAVETARAGHATHGTTRQVLSLITNPLSTLAAELRSVHSQMSKRPDILGTHLEGPFLAKARKGAHDPNYLIDPTPQALDTLLEAADGSLRQITIAPELPGGIAAIKKLVANGVIAAVGHTDANYEQTKQAFDAGSQLLTHIFNAMNGIHHREPGPVPAALENQNVTVEFINDGFHVQSPVGEMVYELFPHRIAGVTDAMAATDCADGNYKLGNLEVQVLNHHARLVSNGAIAGSTLTLDTSLQRAIKVLGVAPARAVESLTLTPAKVLGVEKENAITEAPLGLLSSGFAADMLLLEPHSLEVSAVWCAGRRLK